MKVALLLLLVILDRNVSSLISNYAVQWNTADYNDHLMTKWVFSTLYGTSLIECAVVCIGNESCSAFYYSSLTTTCHTYLYIMDEDIKMDLIPEVGWRYYIIQGKRCESKWRLYDRKCYFLEREKLRSWYNAKAECVQMKGTLAETPTADVHDYLKGVASTLNETSRYMHSNGDQFGFYLGATDLQTEGAWVWDGSNTSVTYTDWYPGEPNNMHGNEHCLALYSHSYRWADYGCGASLNYICEKKME